MIEFTPDLMMNVPLIDEQHMALVKHLQEVVTMGTAAASKEEIEKNLLFLGNYAVKHFTDEEALQVRIRYPKYEQHRKLHQQFVTDYKKFVTDYREHGCSTTFVVQLNRVVIRWITQHIQEADLDLSRYIKANNIKC